MHICGNEVFSKILNKPIHGAEINNTSYESQADFHWEKTKKYFFEKPINRKNYQDVRQKAILLLKMHFYHFQKMFTKFLPIECLYSFYSVW